MFSVTAGRRTVQEGPSMVSCRENITYIYLYKEREREREREREGSVNYSFRTDALTDLSCY